MLELGVGLWCLTSLGVNCNSSNCKNKLVLWYICLFICISIIAFKYIDRYINIARVSQIVSKFCKSKHGLEGKEKMIDWICKIRNWKLRCKKFLMAPFLMGYPVWWGGGTPDTMVGRKGGGYQIPSTEKYFKLKTFLPSRQSQGWVEISKSYSGNQMLVNEYIFRTTLQGVFITCFFSFS